MKENHEHPDEPYMIEDIDFYYGGEEDERLND